MQTGTTPARRIATEPQRGRSASPTGPCRTETPAAAVTAPPSGAASALPDAVFELSDAVGLAEVAA